MNIQETAVVAKTRCTHAFGLGSTVEEASKELLGGKGAGLAEMTRLGLPVPPGFTIDTEACRRYFGSGRRLPAQAWQETLDALRDLESRSGKRLGAGARPLLVSVRSGARVSMPGMMDTVLNLGLNERSVRAIADASGSERFAADSWRRFLAMFGSIVLGVRKEIFSEALEAKKKARGARFDTELDAAALLELVADYKARIEEATRRSFPEDPIEQLRLAVEAVFDSWFGARAVSYRKIYAIPDRWGTAANVQAMVFGNLGPQSGSGVAFTRDPNTGERRLFGEFLFNAQGEDVVAGIRTPLPAQALERELPKAYGELQRISAVLERHYRDMLDIEFTVEQERLFMLQVRVGKRTAHSALRMAIEMEAEGLIDRATAVRRFAADQLEQLLHPTVDPQQRLEIVAKGLPASRGAAAGQVVFTAKHAEDAGARGEKVILVRADTSPEDIAGMHAAQGILTARGGMTSHAAVVARGMGKCCVVGCESLEIDERGGAFKAGGRTIRAGDMITLNGSTGEVILGEAKLKRPETGPELETLLAWADGFRRLGVRANADTPEDARVARANGAEGIGLCRTEHMFFAEDRILAVREMILAEDAAGRHAALEKLLPMQRGDFTALFKEMAGFPVTIRLLDPPLHEFLPQTKEAIEGLSRDLGVPPERIAARVHALSEFNPMLGHRGCRVGITYPEIYEMQTRAVIEAACDVALSGVRVRPEIMIPLVAEEEELRRLKELCTRTADAVLASRRLRVTYQIGTMIETPRAAILADRIARQAEFFSFGTNDLTQMTFGLSRDDAGKFLATYVSQGVLPEDPFVSVDRDGVGALIRWAVERGRSTRRDLKIGICGEHGGDPRSVAFFHEVGLDYVSCSPFRVPVARLAAAQAALRAEEDASV